MHFKVKLRKFLHFKTMPIHSNFLLDWNKEQIRAKMWKLDFFFPLLPCVGPWELKWHGFSKSYVLIGCLSYWILCSSTIQNATENTPSYPKHVDVWQNRKNLLTPQLRTETYKTSLSKNMPQLFLQLFLGQQSHPAEEYLFCYHVNGKQLCLFILNAPANFLNVAHLARLAFTPPKIRRISGSLAMLMSSKCCFVGFFLSKKDKTSCTNTSLREKKTNILIWF